MAGDWGGDSSGQIPDESNAIQNFKAIDRCPKWDSILEWSV